MKMQRLSFLSGMLTMVLIGSLTFSALAATGSFTISVDPVNIEVNGTAFSPKDAKGNDVPVFAYNGTTYAPLRALAEAYGLEVGYNANTNMATVKDTSPMPTVSDKIAYYENTSVPMVENILNVPYADKYVTNSGTGYYYNTSDLMSADPDAKLITFYTNLLETFGYKYLTTSEDNTVIYNNAELGNESVAIYTTREGTAGYLVVLVLPKSQTP